MRRPAAAQRVEAPRQHINREQARHAELQYTMDILHQQQQRQEAPINHMQQQPNANYPPPPPPLNQIPHQAPPPPPPHNHFLHPPHPSHKSAPQILRAHWSTACNLHHDPRITEPPHHLNITTTLTLTNF
jgi:hypothetical protein